MINGALMVALSLCSDFSLLEGQTQESPLTKQILNSFEQGQSVFGWAHLGTVEVEIENILSAIQRYEELTPLRTGHLGNWQNIFDRRACAIDYNSIIAADLDLAKLCIFDLNMTESDDQEDGDWIYLPGSSVSGTSRRPLPLLGHVGGRLIPLEHSLARYVPFMWTQRPGDGLVPLVRYHKQRAASVDGFDFEYQSEAIVDSHERVRAMLIDAVERICATPGATADRMLGLLFDKSVVLEGKMDRLDLTYRQGIFELEDGTRFEGADHLVDAAFLPMLAAADPDKFWSDLGSAPSRFPMFSGPLIAFLLAALERHFIPSARGAKPMPFSPHVHWGALGMAGYPPYKRGYFAKNVKHSRKIYDLLITPDSGLPPIYFMLLPSAIFHLYIHNALTQDQPPIERLIDRVHRETDGLRGKSNLIAASIRTIAEEWVSKEGLNVSSYLRAKFANRRSVLNDADLPDPGGALIEPAGFRTLTCLQACMLVGALHEASWPFPSKFSND